MSSGIARPRDAPLKGMYVNELTLEYGERGQRAVQKLLDEAFGKGILRSPVTAEYA